MILDRVLVGVDGADGGWAALAEALRLHRSGGGTLVALTVCEEGWAALAGPLATHAADEIRADAEAAHARAEELLAGVPGTSAELVRGRAADALLARAHRLDASLVVVGRRRRDRPAGVLAGGVVATLVRSAPCSVLVVRYENGNGLPASAGTT